MTNQNFQAAAKHVASFRKTKYHTMAAIVQQIRSEMKYISLKKHNSLLRIDRDDSKQNEEQAVKNFTWRKQRNLLDDFGNNHRKKPTNVGTLRTNSSQTVLICIILKKNCMHMSLLQCVFSVVLYANTTHKEVSTIDCASILL